MSVHACLELWTRKVPQGTMQWSRNGHVGKESKFYFKTGLVLMGIFAIIIFLQLSNILSDVHLFYM